MCMIDTNINKTAIIIDNKQIKSYKHKMSSDDQSDKECPLCMEAFDIDDINFYPCSCQYQICRFCWHRIRTNENGLCPACRQSYPEDPVNFQPLSHAELLKIKSEKKQKVQQQKNKVIESRKHLAEFRVLQKNLVYAVGLSQRMADQELLKKPDFFGKFGKIIKVAVGTAQALNNFTPPTHTAYVTYARNEDALRAIQAVNNMVMDGRMLKASLGTTKYCSNFLKGQACYKPECMYLHDVAEEEISFTKEDMHQGKHTEYERRLYEQMMLLQQQQSAQCAVGLNNGKDVSIHHKNNTKSKTATTADQSKKKRPGSAENLVKVSQPLQSTEPLSNEQNEIFLLAQQTVVQKIEQQEKLHKKKRPGSVENLVKVSQRAQLAEHPTKEQKQKDTFLSQQAIIQLTEKLRKKKRSGSAENSIEISQQTQPAEHLSDKQQQQNETFLSQESIQIAEQQEKAELPSSSASQSVPVDSSYSFLLDHDDDLGFDPFTESVKALEEIMEEERQHHFITSTAQTDYSYNNNYVNLMNTPSSNHLYFQSFAMDQSPQQQRVPVSYTLQQPNCHLSQNNQFQHSMLGGVLSHQQQRQNNYAMNNLTPFTTHEPTEQNQHQPSSSPYSTINSTNSQHYISQSLGGVLSHQQQRQNNYAMNNLTPFTTNEPTEQNQHQPFSSPFSAINSTNSQHYISQSSNNNGINNSTYISSFMPTPTATNNQNYYGMLSQQQQQTQSNNSSTTFNTMAESSGWLQVPPGFSPRTGHC